VQNEKEIILSLSKEKGDFVVQTFRSGGPGGQNQNKVSSGCRVKHPASGAAGESRTHKSQHQNKKAAFRRLVKSETFQNWLKLELARRGVQTDSSHTTGIVGGRTMRVRTYNLFRGTVKDHRSGYMCQNAGQVLDGNLDGVIESLRRWETEELLDQDEGIHNHYKKLE